jgi:hypothetical protein
MSKITQIQQDNRTRRILVYIGYRFCATIRPDVWDAMELKEGDEITCAELHRKEKEVYNKSRKQNRSETNKQAMNRIVRWFDKYIPTLDAKIIEFKFDDNEYGYPWYRYDRNISLFLKGTNTELITLEVATIEIQKGIHNWVNADKIISAQSQSKRDGWAALYCKYPVERIVWIKPNPRIIYKTEEIIKGSKQQFVFFKNDSPEVYPSSKFFKYIQARIDGKLLQELDGNISDTRPKIIRLGSSRKNNAHVVLSSKAVPTSNDA